MKRAFVYKDAKSDKFWWIDAGGNDFAVNYGRSGTTGKYEIKEFGSAAECEKEAARLVAQKLKKGYVEFSSFNFMDHFYFDDPEVGLHSKTSHPNFSAHFREEFYYDCADEEAPFGSDEGADSLAELEEYVRKHGMKGIGELPRRIIEEAWGMVYVPPRGEDRETLAALLGDQESEYEMLIPQSDQVVIAVALGQVKIAGTIDRELKELALASIQRLSLSAGILGWGFSGTALKMKEDLESFNGNR